jgi:hypothetical protein
VHLEELGDHLDAGGADLGGLGAAPGGVRILNAIFSGGWWDRSVALPAGWSPWAAINSPQNREHCIEIPPELRRLRGVNIVEALGLPNLSAWADAACCAACGCARAGGPVRVATGGHFDTP